MKNIVGTPARGENFFPRKSEVDKILDRLQGGNNLQIAAPRRVGKTSILLHLLDNHVKNYHYIYVDTERVDNEKDFFKKLLKEILRDRKITESRKLQALFEKGGRFLGRIKSIKVFGHGLDLHEENTDPDYYEELCNFLCDFELEDNQKLVLLIDEFPQTILNITDANSGDTKNAKQFLQANREMRLNPDINSKVQFIYTGSIGLNHTVASIQSSAFVNDLNTVEIDTLTSKEATTFISQLLNDQNIPTDVILYLLHKIRWLVPFHIQLVVQEILNIMRYEGNTVTQVVVDNAFETTIQHLSIQLTTP